MPLFEAIVNSIQAIEDAREQTGVININILRDTSPLLVEPDKGLRDIVGFEIVDNGIGFTDDNFGAFQTSDTTYKADRGGKGIGRFAWLVAFRRVEVESTYEEKSAWKFRKFNFVPVADGISGEALSESPVKRRNTQVRLRGFKEKYSAAAPKKIDTIAAHIVEHCLEYFIRPNPPSINLVDAGAAAKLDLNNVFETSMAVNATVVPFKVADKDFNILHVKLYSSHIKDHQLHYCANDRAVKSDRLAGKIPDLSKRLIDEKGRDFVYASYVDSKVLDNTVNQERTDFSIASDDGSLPLSDITWSAVRDAATEQAKAFLSPFTKPIREKKDQRIARYVATEGPMYRPILKYAGDAIDAIDPDISDDELDIKLYKAYHDLQVQLRAEGQELMRNPELDSGEFDQFSRDCELYFAKISDVNTADLARYVFHRRLVLEFLQRLLRRQSEGGYALEERVHQLIFPMGITSDDVPLDEHNLWLLDERLAYHKYLASDKQLRTLKPLVNNSKKELDIVVFDKACAFSGSSDIPFQTVTIVEFKRPMRKNYPVDEDPFEQVVEYVELIQSGKARTPDGRDVPVSPNVQFFCYIVADKTEKLDRYARKAGCEPMPDNQGYFGYNKPLRAYIELVTYSKMVEAAKQRNQMFFDKLGLPAIMRDSTPDPQQHTSTPRPVRVGDPVSTDIEPPAI